MSNTNSKNTMAAACTEPPDVPEPQPWAAQRRWNAAHKEYFAARMHEKYHTDPEFKSRHIAYVISSRKKKRANTE
jgi:hypothetical protein